MTDNFYSLTAKTNKGNEISMETFKGKAIIVVNTASKCGFTPQYKALEELYKKYKDKGLEIVGFPCDQFAHQEPLGDQAIAEFCSLNYGVTFPLMSKIEVNGKGTHPVFAYLKSKAPGLIGSSVKWNFTKFLVSKDAQKVKRFSPDTDPLSMEGEIQKALGL